MTANELTPMSASAYRMMKSMAHVSTEIPVARTSVPE